MPHAYPQAFASGSDTRVLPALTRNRRLLMRLAEQLTALPLRLEVDAETPFAVVHTDWLAGWRHRADGDRAPPARDLDLTGGGRASARCARPALKIVPPSKPCLPT